MNCIDNIIGLRGVCGQPDTPTLSGYYLTDYPGITIRTASQINDEKTIQGATYLADLRRRAMLRLDGDVQNFLAANYRVNSIPANNWSTGDYKTNIIAPGTAGTQRGLVAYKKNVNCRFVSMVLTSVRILTNHTGPTILTIKDTGGFSYTAPITLEAGVVLELSINKPIVGDEFQVTLPSEIPVYSTSINCGVGCNNTIKSECVRVNGLYNQNLNTSEGYGISANILCKCDLSKVTCELATQRLIGQAAFELCGAMFYEEAITNGRISYLTIYQPEQLQAESDKAYGKYEEYLKNMFAGLRQFLVRNDGNCGCIDYQGIQIKTSV